MSPYRMPSERPDYSDIEIEPMPRRTGATLLRVLAVLGIAIPVAHLGTDCHTLTPAEQAVVASDGVKLSMCATEAHLCKLDSERIDAGSSRCWDEYVMCKTAHGFDGGAR